MDKETIRQRWAKPTKGPYYSHPVSDFHGAVTISPDPERDKPVIALACDDVGRLSKEQLQANGEAFAHSWQDIRVLLTALDVAEAKATKLRTALLIYVEEFAGIHDDECPQDDTCTCERVRFAEEALKEGK